MPTPNARPLFLFAVLFAPLGVIAPKGLVPLLFIIALWLFARRCRQGQWRRPFSGPVAVVFGAVAAWALISSLWALDGQAALSTFAKLAGVLLTTLVVLDGLRDLETVESRPIWLALVWSFAAAAVLLAGETLSGAAGHKWLVWQGRRAEYDLTVLNRAGTLLWLAAWPTALVLWRQGRRVVALAAIFVAAAVVLAGVSSANQVAVLIATLGAGLAWLFGRRFVRLLALFAAVSVLAAPVLPSSLLAPERLARHFDENHYSGLHRLHIWYFTAQRIADAPIAGWGLDAARRIPGGNEKLPGGGNVMSVHPHNAGLQIWLELGAVGALLAAVVVAGLFLRCGTLPEAFQRAAATGMALSALVVANLSFGIWQTWWMASLGSSAVLFALALRPGVSSGK